MTELDRRTVLKGLSAVAIAGSGLFKVGTSAASVQTRAASSRVDKSDGLTWLPAWQLREMIVKRQISSVEVVEHFLKRIEELDPQLHAFRELDAAGAREQAANADKLLLSGGTPGLLHGVPIALKELYTVKGFSLPGSYFGYADPTKKRDLIKAQRDDIEVERLRAAGAVIVGTTIASLSVSPGTPEIPRNPWDLSRTTGGSSAGTAAAVAAGLLPMAMGDDGAGSVRLPSAFCGLFGLHPTRGRIPHVDYKQAAPRPTVTAGPLVRHVRDAALAMQILAGPDGRDFVCMQDEPPDYLKDLEKGIKGKHFTWTENFGSAQMPDSLKSLQVISTIHEAAGALQKAGGKLSDCTTAWEDPLPSWLAAQQLAGANMTALMERPFSEAELIAALESRQRNWQRFRDTFKQVDFVISPTLLFIAPKLTDWIEFCKQEGGGNPKHRLWLETFVIQTMMCNTLGLPAISVPAGFVDGMPVGLQVIGRPNSEAQLLQVASAFLLSRGH